MSTKVRCQCYESQKEKSVQCSLNAKEGSKYCGIHKNCRIIFGQMAKSEQKKQKKQKEQKKQLPEPIRYFDYLDDETIHSVREKLDTKTLIGNFMFWGRSVY